MHTHVFGTVGISVHLFTRRLSALALVSALATACGDSSPAAPGAPDGLEALRQGAALASQAQATELLRITPTALEFGEVQVGTSSPTQIVTITNVSAASLELSGAGGAPGGAFEASQNCQGVTLAPGASCQMSFTFLPTEAGVQTATSTGSWNDQAFQIQLRGTGVLPRLRVTPAALEFGEIQLGAVSPQQVVTVTNAGTAPVEVSGVGGAPGGPFTATQSCQGVTLAPGASCQMLFTFSPAALGLVTATSAGAWNDVPFEVQLRGTGIAAGSAPSAQFLVTPTALEFGQVVAGTTSPEQLVTITNLGAAAVELSGAGGAPGGPFDAAQNCQGVTLAPGASCQMSFTFSPTAPGAAAAASAGSWNEQAFQVELRGTGVLPGLLVTPTGLEFGEVQVGATSPAQAVTVTNTGSTTLVMSGTGGAPGGPFSATQNCQGVTLAPGASCQMSFAFSPAAPGVVTATSAGTWNDVPFEVALRGRGLGDGPPGDEDSFGVVFHSPLGRSNPFRAGSSVPVHFSVRGEDGGALSRAQGQAIAAACGATIEFSGGTPAAACARYAPGNGRFSFVLRLDRNLSPGTYVLTVRVVSGGTTLGVGIAEVQVF